MELQEAVFVYVRMCSISFPPPFEQDMYLDGAVEEQQINQDWFQVQLSGVCPLSGYCKQRPKRWERCKTITMIRHERLFCTEPHPDKSTGLGKLHQHVLLLARRSPIAFLKPPSQGYPIQQTFAPNNCIPHVSQHRCTKTSSLAAAAVCAPNAAHGSFWELLLATETSIRLNSQLVSLYDVR